MNSLINIPETLADFLPWLKERSEAAWASYRTKTFSEFEDDGVGGSSWRTGTKWQEGLGEPQIDALELQWKLKFPKDYRQFLAVLNALDRGAYSVGWSDDPPFGMVAGDDEPTYFDWQKDDAEIADALAWPLTGLLFDIENNSMWLESWGAKPSEPAEIEKRLAQLVATAPKLIPITGHRYLLADTLEPGNPVLSVWQSDIISYGSNLRNFLLLEFSHLLELNDHEVGEIANLGMKFENISDIPFWGEIMLWDGG